jgi:hypothetical protein
LGIWKGGNGETCTNNTPSVDARVLLLNFLQQAWDLSCGLGWCALVLEEVSEGLSFLVVVGWIPIQITS